MSSALVAAMLLLGLGVIVVRRRSAAIALIAAQSLVLGIGALGLASGRSGDYLVASLVLITKAVVLINGKYQFNGDTYKDASNQMKLSAADTTLANCLATQLDNYNNDRPNITAC